MIQERCDVDQTQQPRIAQSSGPVHDSVRGILKLPDPIFREVLMLVFRLTHVVATLVHPDNVVDLRRDLRFGAIAYQAIHGSTMLSSRMPVNSASVLHP